MKKLAILTLPLFLSIVVTAQDFEIKSGSKGLFLVHKVAPKEGLFPLGRMYNVHPRHIANFNGIDFNKGLAIGQLINIPLSDTNFKQNVNTGVPVYYIPDSKESLANISVKYKTPMNSLRGWNNLRDDNVSPNSKIIIGFLITNELKDKVVTLVTETKPKVEESVSNVKKAEEQKKTVVTEVVKESEPRKEEPKKVESEIKKEAPPVVKEEPKKTEPVIVKQTESVNSDGTGYFRNNFYQQVKNTPQSKEQTVTSSIFKTNTGWQDGKYYLLINGVEPGTIVKLTNPSNSKFVFAKVLYSMDKIRENQGVDIRISDAAAASLSVNETDKFILKVNY
jgi:LysM repeat protein